MRNQNSGAKQSSSTPRWRAVRLGRLLATVRIVLTVLIIVAVTIAGLASLDNALAPAVRMTYAASGPAALSVVRTLEIDTKTGTLYAGSNTGVFKSTDGGLNWLPAGNGLPGIDIQDLQYDAATGNLYTVVFGVGLFKSTDGAQSWVNISKGLNGQNVLTVGIDRQTGTLYAGLVGYGMYNSNDGGNHWETIGMELSNMTIRSILTGPKPGEVFAASDSGVYHTTNVTGTWDLLTGQPRSMDAWSLLRDDKTGILYAGTAQGVVKLESDQQTYLESLTGLTGPLVQALAMDEQSGTLYAGTTQGVYHSTDSAKTWTLNNQGLQSTLVRALLLNPQSKAVLAGTDSGIYRSTDGAASWQGATANPSAQYVQALLVNPPDNTVYAGTLGGGVFRSNDGGTNWQPINTGLRATVVQALGIDHDTNTLFAGTRDGLYRTPVNNIGWTLVSPRMAGQDVLQIAVDERRGNIYAVTSYGDVFRSSNAGADWAIVQRLQRTFARTVTVSYFSSAIYEGAYKGGVTVSRDGGYSWQTMPNMADRNIETLAVDERNGTVYAGTLGGAVFSLNPADIASGWQSLGSNLPSNVVALAVDEKSSTVLATVKEGLYRMGPGDRTWQLATKGMGHTDMMALAANRTSGTVYAGTMAGGAYRSNDGGVNWQPVSKGLTDIDMRGIVASHNGSLLVSATGRGVFQSDTNQKSWQPANAGLADLASTTSLAGNGSGGADVLTGAGTYQSVNADTGLMWQPRAGWLNDLSGLIIPLNAYGFVGRLPSGNLVWAARGGGAAWAAISSGVGLVNATIQSLPDGQGVVYAVWGAELTRSDPGSGYGRVPLVWMLARAWVWTLFTRLDAAASWWWAVVVGLVVLGAILWLLGRVRLSRSFGVPLGVALTNPGKSPQVAQQEKVEHAWTRWERAIHMELYTYGDVRTVDLLSVPGPFRLYAMRRYADANGKQQAVDFRNNRLYARTRDYIRHWVNGWHALRTDLRHDWGHWQRRNHTTELAQALTAVLGLQVLPPKDNDSVRAYATRAPEGTTSALPRYALLFVADNEALKRTAQNIIDALDSLDVPGAKGLVFSPGRPGRNVDVTTQIRSAVAELDAAQRERLVVLSSDQVLSIMANADPMRALAEAVEEREPGR